MWYAVSIAIVFYFLVKNRTSSKGIIDQGIWEEERKQKAESLATLKKSFKPAANIETAITQVSKTLDLFHKNHNQSLKDISTTIASINLPNDIIKRESVLKKEINRFYKQRSNLRSKAIAIQLSFEHVKLHLQNLDHDWKSFTGLQKLQSSWKAEEYFKDLLLLMMAYQNAFPNSSNINKLLADIDRMFQLWNSQNIARKNYEAQILSYQTATSYSDQHFIIYSIIEYLERRYKFNPKCRDELVDWCLKDIDLYERFLKEFYYREFFSINQQMEFHDNPSLKQKKLDAINFERVKKLKNYTVPRLNSYDVLRDIYKIEKNENKLQWLQKIGKRIGYVDNVLER